MRYIDVTATFEPEGSQFVSLCPELGTSSCGDTPQEALENLGEAVILHLNGLEQAGTRDRIFAERGIEIRYRSDELPSEQQFCPRQFVDFEQSPTRPLVVVL